MSSPVPPSPVLFVAAVPAELGDLPGEPLGIGLVAASASMATLLVTRRPAAVVLVGTAGAFVGPDAPAVGSVIVGRRLGLGSAAVALAVGYQPGAPAPLHADPTLLAALVAGHPSPLAADVLTNLAITTSPELSATFGAAWGVEHMETFGAAWACHAARVPFACVLGITNRVGPDAHAEWRANRGAAEAAAREVARRSLAEAPGPR